MLCEDQSFNHVPKGKQAKGTSKGNYSNYGPSTSEKLVVPAARSWRKPTLITPNSQHTRGEEKNSRPKGPGMAPLPSRLGYEPNGGAEGGGGAEGAMDTSVNA